jgi:hypothetical protein
MVDVDGGRHPPLKFFFLEINLCRVPQLNTQKIKMPHHVLSPSYVREATFFPKYPSLTCGKGLAECLKNTLGKVASPMKTSSNFAEHNYVQRLRQIFLSFCRVFFNTM